MANEKAVIEIDETPAPVAEAETGKITLAEAKDVLGTKEAEMAKKDRKSTRLNSSHRL